MSVEAYEKAEEERRLFKRLAKGGQEIQNGVFHELDDVLADAKALLD